MVLQTAAGSGLQRATTRSPLDWNPSYLTHLEITEIMKFLCSWASHFPVRNFGGLLQVHLPELDRQTPFPDQQGENLLSRSGRGHQVLTSKPFEWSSLKQTEDASLCKCHVMSCVFLNTFFAEWTYGRYAVRSEKKAWGGQSLCLRRSRPISQLPEVPASLCQPSEFKKICVRRHLTADVWSIRSGTAAVRVTTECVGISAHGEPFICHRAS